LPFLLNLQWLQNFFKALTTFIFIIKNNSLSKRIKSLYIKLISRISAAAWSSSWLNLLLSPLLLISLRKPLFLSGLEFLNITEDYIQKLAIFNHFELCAAKGDFLLKKADVGLQFYIAERCLLLI